MIYNILKLILLVLGIVVLSVWVLGTSYRGVDSATLVLASFSKYLKSREISQVEKSLIKVLYFDPIYSNPNPNPNPNPTP